MPESSLFQMLFSSTWAVVLIVLFLGGSIFVHELGHFLAARWRGLQVDRFSIGFGPRLFGWKGKDGVDYRISLLPLGGYVALPQLADMRAIEGDSEEDPRHLPPISYADKVIVAAAGAFFNILLALALATLLWIVGVPSWEGAQTTRVGYIVEDMDLGDGETVPGPAAEAGIRPGDLITAIDGTPVDDFSQIQHTLLTGSGRTAEGNPQAVFTIVRDGEVIDLTVKPQLVVVNAASGDRIRRVGLAPASTLEVHKVDPGSPAEAAGLQKGDVLVEANGTPLLHYQTWMEILERTGTDSLALTVQRGGETVELSARPRPAARTKPLLRLSEGEASVLLQPVYPRAPDGSPPSLNPLDLSAPSTPTVFRVDEAASGTLGTLRPGDEVVAVGQAAVGSLAALRGELRNVREDGQSEVALTLSRGGQSRTVWLDTTSLEDSIRPPETTPLLGIVFAPQSFNVHPGPFEQFGDHIRTTIQVLGSLLSPKSDIGLSSLSGPPGIMRVIGHFADVDIRLVVWFVVLLNINLAILNLLPIPVLDGGHIVFATAGKLRGKPLPPQLVAGLQGAFMIALFSLMLYVSFFDVRRWMGDAQSEREGLRESSIYLSEPVFTDAPDRG